MADMLTTRKGTGGNLAVRTETMVTRLQEYMIFPHTLTLCFWHTEHGTGLLLREDVLYF